MGALTALLNSEKAVAGGVLIIAATVLAALGHMTVSEWTSYTEVIFGAYIIGKTVQGGVTAIAERSVAPVAPAAVAGPVVVVGQNNADGGGA